MRALDQNGAMLITLIVTMVFIGLAATAMLHYSSTSTYGELLLNRQQKAHYLAESGVKYARQQFFNTPVGNPGLYQNTSPGPFPDKQTFYLKGTDGQPNGDKFEVKTSYILKNGEHWMVIRSWGTTGSGWLKTRISLTMEFSKSSLTPPGLPIDTPIDLDNGSGSVEEYWTATEGTAVIDTTGQADGDELMFQGVTGELKLDWATNATAPNLTNAWQSNGQLLSYLMQVKIKVEPNNNKGKHFLAGLTFRLNENGNYYGLSFYRAYDNNPKTAANTWWPALSYKPPNHTSKIYAVLWKNVGSTRTILAWADLTGTGVIVPPVKEQTLAQWSTIVLQLNERFDGPGKTRRNHIKAYVIGPAAYPKGTINWNLSFFSPVSWNATTGLNPSSQPGLPSVILEDSFTSDGFSNNRPEIGIHILYDANANREQFFADFALAVQGIGGGIIY